MRPGIIILVVCNNKYSLFTATHNHYVVCQTINCCTISGNPQINNNENAALNNCSNQMLPKMILETKRLTLRHLTLEDDGFILKLLNTPTWLKFIGNKNVYNIQDAKNYLTNGPMTSYKEHGFGLWLVLLKETNTPIGICGLLKREYLENVDIGFALLPDYEGLGYGFEITSATIEHSRNILLLDKIVAITDAYNASSIKLLNKLGFHFDRKVITSDKEEVLLFS